MTGGVGFLLNGEFSRLVEPLHGRVADKELINRYLSLSTNLKMLAATMAYLASDVETKFLLEIPVSAIVCLLRDGFYNRKSVSVSGNAPFARIRSAEYVVLYQLAKNASAGIVVNLAETGSCRMLSVSDQGNGILDEQGNPLPEERLPELFGGFTTKGESHGFGLHAVKALADLMGGYVAVATRTEGNVPLSYSTRAGESSPLPAQFPHGTTFGLYLPK